ncbi:alpha-N-acetyl-neuraminyl-2,3-beta-galactosyl-1,3-N-acetyl-galactosaminide alpha-2,6-sialyltransferase-like [Acanthaster planci]|uniref:Alpha-N-acetyl-neuraminyl-2,3-beta-galactosyl-1, 3-N-acetyl-galactosaminide alpha-2,6-sialyltransferase-like n=1 Tax=Acanthaster planci TaxID=133434 RepID=A0A8B7ZIK5_ACAPL|nr:alpha-N-acetyl-neuraminyl-2,3-beta-galactosyl-1,3-N-acetyl-galactosaminide alpha-2,6-sialyltransferase-like [Acanthaster planci]
MFQKLHLHCKSCAVVSSSGQLLNKSAGAEIDSYPCVIRMNSAPITGYQADVGTRTTARVMGHVNLLKLNQSQADQHQIFVNRSTRTQRLIIPWLFNTRVDKRKDKHYAIAKNFSKTYTNTEFYMLSSSKIAFAENLFQTNTGISRKDAKTWLSTGWMTLIFALDTCDRTDVFGLVHDKFCKENPNNTTPYHYYEVNGKKECEYYMQSETHLTSGHVFVTEKAIFARWARKFNLNFRYPTWNLTRNESAPLDTPFVKIYKEAQHNKSLHGNKVGGGARGRSHVLNLRSKKMPPIIGPKTKEDTEKEKYQRFTHAVMFIVAIFLSLVVFLLLFLLVSILTI